MNDFLDSDEERDRRPVFLTVVGILSLVNISWSLIQNITSFLSGPLTEEGMEAYRLEMAKSLSAVQDTGAVWAEDLIQSAMNMAESINVNHTMNLLSSTVILIIGLAAVIMMLKGKKIGFHGYIIYSFLASVQIYLFVTPSLLPNIMVIFSLLASGLFILFYGLNLKWMK